MSEDVETRTRREWLLFSRVPKLQSTWIQITNTVTALFSCDKYMFTYVQIDTMTVNIFQSLNNYLYFIISTALSHNSPLPILDLAL